MPLLVHLVSVLSQWFKPGVTKCHGWHLFRKRQNSSFILDFAYDLARLSSILTLLSWLFQDTVVKAGTVSGRAMWTATSENFPPLCHETSNEVGGEERAKEPPSCPVCSPQPTCCLWPWNHPGPLSCLPNAFLQRPQGRRKTCACAKTICSATSDFHVLVIAKLVRS